MKQSTDQYAKRNPKLESVVLMILKDYQQEGFMGFMAGKSLLNRVKITYLFPKVDNRKVRFAINCMRKDGIPILSTGGDNGGYKMANNPQELKEYIDEEVMSRILDLAHQRRALKQALKIMTAFPGDFQPHLINV